eukprot:gene10763-14454_t
MSSGALYFQKSQVFQDEFKLVELTTIREIYVEELENIIKSMKEGKAMDDAMIFNTFSLFNKVRNATMDVIDAAWRWQDIFTKPLRPQLLSCDYLTERLIKHIDFVNGSNIRKMFNFQFKRGNVLLLPFPGVKIQPPIKLNTALAKEVYEFANPSEERLTHCYQMLLNTLSDEEYSKIVSLQEWLIESWIPRIWISDDTLNKPQENYMKRERNKIPTNKNNDNKNELQITPETKEKLPTMMNMANEKRRASVSSRSTIQSNGTNQESVNSNHFNSRKTSVSHIHNNNDNSFKLKRRNQLMKKDARKILSLTNPKLMIDSHKTNQIVSLTEAEKEELHKLDSEHKDIQSLFLPILTNKAKLALTNMTNNNIDTEKLLDIGNHTMKKILYIHENKKIDFENDDVIVPIPITVSNSIEKDVEIQQPITEIINNNDLNDSFDEKEKMNINMNALDLIVGTEVPLNNPLIQTSNSPNKSPKFIKYSHKNTPVKVNQSNQTSSAKSTKRSNIQLNKTAISNANKKANSNDEIDKTAVTNTIIPPIPLTQDDDQSQGSNQSFATIATGASFTISKSKKKNKIIPVNPLDKTLSITTASMRNWYMTENYQV